MERQQFPSQASCNSQTVKTSESTPCLSDTGGHSTSPGTAAPTIPNVRHRGHAINNQPESQLRSSLSHFGTACSTFIAGVIPVASAVLPVALMPAKEDIKPTNPLSSQKDNRKSARIPLSAGTRHSSDPVAVVQRKVQDMI